MSCWPASAAFCWADFSDRANQITFGAAKAEFGSNTEECGEGDALEQLPRMGSRPCH